MEFSKILIGDKNTGGLEALKKNIDSLDKNLSYAKMMEYRICGNAENLCTDIYYVAHENGKMLTRLWNGWGKHKDAIGNFGNFLTVEEARGNGIGGKILSMWYDDILNREDVPLALFCSAGSVELVKLYSKFGFKLAVKDTVTGPLYKPLKNSPDTFIEFCNSYYSESHKLFAKKATVEYRHEIDCLLKFALLNNGIEFGFDEVKSVEEVLMFENFESYILFTKDNKAAGWQIVLSDGTVKTQLHPLYANSEIIKSI